MFTDDLKELLKHELGDLYFAEQHFLKGLRKMAREVHHPPLKGRVEKHVEETEKQIQRLRDAFEAIGEKASAEKCQAAIGILDEHDTFVSEQKPGKRVLEAFDLGAGLRVEHYEIAGYRSAISLASSLGEKKCANLLKENLSEEEAMARFLEKKGPGALKKLIKEAAKEEKKRAREETRKARAAAKKGAKKQGKGTRSRRAAATGT